MDIISNLDAERGIETVTTKTSRGVTRVAAVSQIVRPPVRDGLLVLANDDLPTIRR